MIAAIEWLDSMRAMVLRLTLRWRWARDVFRSRVRRLAVFSLLSFGTSLALSFYFPLWVLLFGPLIYGVPHVVSSLRYFSYAAVPRPARALAVAAIFLAAVFCVRIATVSGAVSEWSGSTYIELTGLVLVFGVVAWIERLPGLRFGRGLAVIAPFLIAFFAAPFATIGALVLIHNFVAYGYWWRASRTRAEKLVAAANGIALLMLTAWILWGGADALLTSAMPKRELEFANFSAEQIGLLIFPESGERPMLWLRAAVAFALGQSLHYFVWLKAIPDQYLEHEAPSSFRESFRLLQKDFGKKPVLLILIAVAATYLLWLSLALPTSRLIYFSAASFHGYLEIAGLALAAARLGGPRKSLS